MDAELIALLRCPATGQPLRLLPGPELDEWNRRLAAGPHRQLPDGVELAAPFAAGLATADGSRFYPMLDGIPVLTPDAGFTRP